MLSQANRWGLTKTKGNKKNNKRQNLKSRVPGKGVAKWRETVLVEQGGGKKK